MNTLTRFRAPVAALLAAFLAANAVALENPPATIDYQGKVYDLTGKPYGVDENDPTIPKPTNYTMVFRIYDRLSGGDSVRLWSESQVVTVSAGQFSVRLGEGVTVPNEARPPLAGVFDASSRYLEVTLVVPPQTIETALPISPRLAFLTTPYAFTTQNAKNAEKAASATSAENVTQTSGTATFSDATFTKANITTFTGGSITATTLTGNGAALTDLDASKITSGTLNEARLPASAVKATAVNTFTGINTFSNANNSFTGKGGGLTQLNASNITTGVLAKERLAPEVVTGSLDDRVLLIRGALDPYHGLVYTGSTNTLKLASSTGDTFKNLLTSYNIEGPILYGTFGGALGYPDIVSNKTLLKPVLQWWKSTGQGERVSDGVMIRGTLRVTNHIRLDNNRSDNPAWRILADGNGDLAFNILNSGGSPANNGIKFLRTGQIWMTGYPLVISDTRLKKDVSPIGPTLGSLLKLEPITYRLKSEPASATKSVGFIAQEVEKVFPETVGRNSDGTLALRYTDFGVYAVEGLKELTTETREKDAAAETEIQRLREENAALRQSLTDIEQRLNALEAR